MGYVDGLLSVPLFKQKVKKQTLTAFELAGNVRIEVATCDYRAVRSYTCGAALCDEACSGAMTTASIQRKRSLPPFARA